MVVQYKTNINNNLSYGQQNYLINVSQHNPFNHKQVQSVDINVIPVFLRCN